MAEQQPDVISLNHGSAGMVWRALFDRVFARHFTSPILARRTDSAVLGLESESLAFTTDSYVVKPLFFPGGNIGTLAVCGTVNDLAVSGARPLWLSAAFIIEEGFPVRQLEEIVAAMAERAAEAGVAIVTGDTKVVDHGGCDGVFITTAGVGRLSPERRHISFGERIQPGDVVIVNGTVGDHGMAILAAREQLPVQTTIVSDCAPLAGLIEATLDAAPGVRFMRDATRGGLASVLCELTEGRAFGMHVSESAIPVGDEVSGLCDMLGFDPLYVANEGKVVVVLPAAEADAALKAMRAHPYGVQASRIGIVTAEHAGRVVLETEIGGTRMLEIPAGDQLPRIC